MLEKACLKKGQFSTQGQCSKVRFFKGYLRAKHEFHVAGCRATMIGLFLILLRDTKFVLTANIEIATDSEACSKKGQIFFSADLHPTYFV
jgi:hypothetical protein